MATIGKVSAVFTANTSGLVTGVNQAASSMRKMQASTASLASGIRTLVAIQGAQLFASVASSAAQYVRSLIAVGGQQAEVIDQQSKLAARLGMTYGEFAGLALAGDLAGVGMDTLANAATKADVAFVKAINGSAQAQAAFTRLGLSLDDLGGMSAADRFAAISSAIAGLPTEAERAAAAVALFGKAGAQLLPLFAGGADGIAQAREQAERLGLALTTAQGQDVEAMNDAFTLASKAISGVVQQVVAYLSPALKAAADTFTNLVGSIGGANIGQAIGEALLEGARFLAGVGDFLITNLSSVWQYVAQVGSQWANVVDVMARVASLASAIFNGAQAAFGLIILGLSGVFGDIARVAQQIGKFLGFDTATIDSIVAGADAFTSKIAEGLDQNLMQLDTDLAAVFGDKSSMFGEAVAGPLTTALDDAIARAEESAQAIDVAGKGAAATVTAASTMSAQQATERPAITGADSRSREGIELMFRLMRDGDRTIQEKSLETLKQIEANTSNMEIDFDVAEFAPAAGV